MMIPCETDTEFTLLEESLQEDQSGNEAVPTADSHAESAEVEGAEDFVVCSPPPVNSIL